MRDLTPSGRVERAERLVRVQQAGPVVMRPTHPFVAASEFAVLADQLSLLQATVLGREDEWVSAFSQAGHT